MGTRLVAIILMIVALAAPQPGRAEKTALLVESLPLGQVDWRLSLVRAVGQSAPSKKDFGKTADPKLALAAARAAADRNLLETFKAVRLRGGDTVGQAALGQNKVMEKLQAMIAALKTDKKDYLSDGTVQITLKLSLLGGVSQLILPPEIQQVEPIRPVSAPLPKEAVPSKTAGDGKDRTGIFTGLVVDARALPFRPAMVVRVVDETAKAVYGPAFVSREHAVQRGVCGFHTSMDKARQDPRIGKKPLTVKGLKLGDGGDAVVVSNADAAKLRSAGEHLAFLRQCRVVFVLPVLKGK